MYWPSRELSYALNARGFPGLPLETVRSVAVESFSAWENVRCDDGKPVGLLIEQESETTTLEIGPKGEEPNGNVLVHFSPETWEDDPRAFAITKVWYDRKTGIIIGADIKFNGGMDPWGVCPANGCEDNQTTDLKNVLTHEAGHFLGLAHSDDPDSTMWCDASPGEVDKRDLGLDDVAGLCAMYGPHADPDPDTTHGALARRSKASCSVTDNHRPAGASHAWWVLWTAILGLYAWRRRCRSIK